MGYRGPRCGARPPLGGPLWVGCSVCWVAAKGWRPWRTDSQIPRLMIRTCQYAKQKIMPILIRFFSSTWVWQCCLGLTVPFPNPCLLLVRPHLTLSSCLGGLASNLPETARPMASSETSCVGLWMVLQTLYLSRLILKKIENYDFLNQS